MAEQPGQRAEFRTGLQQQSSASLARIRELIEVIGGAIGFVSSDQQVLSDCPSWRKVRRFALVVVVISAVIGAALIAALLARQGTLRRVPLSYSRWFIDLVIILLVGLSAALVALFISVVRRAMRTHPGALTVVSSIAGASLLTWSLSVPIDHLVNVNFTRAPSLMALQSDVIRLKTEVMNLQKEIGPSQDMNLQSDVMGLESHVGHLQTEVGLSEVMSLQSQVAMLRQEIQRISGLLRSLDIDDPQ